MQCAAIANCESQSKDCKCTKCKPDCDFDGKGGCSPKPSCRPITDCLWQDKQTCKCTKCKDIAKCKEYDCFTCACTKCWSGRLYKGKCY
ncbi:DNA topoisomerase I [Chlorella sorokiniana]|uniref:DNA topoisomerase I n=1 Tax=Chlorella sorokiniana TaxID=3076 RepID=A0A2P6U2W7_CHLSO|nr:DNA topoisomerase I [Chlorella sorokiniana]|eukprot:PRW60652.1 DNA topoisomerase I [Chlorella sorokiniana]